MGGMAAAERELLSAAIAARLKAARVDAGMTQQVAADRIGMGRSALSDVERGAARRAGAGLVGFAQLYAVGLDVLLEGA